MSERPPTGPRGSGRWTRRGLLLAAAASAGGGLAACSVGAPPRGAPGTVTVTEPPATAPPVTVTAPPSAAEPEPVPELPERPGRWVASEAEVLPACKQAAADYLAAVLSVEDRGRDDDGLLQRLAPLGQPVEPALPLLGLLPGRGPAALQVGYPQYGGLSSGEDAASQMVVGEQLLLDADGQLVRRPFAADVRLRLDGDRWLVTAVVPGFPDPPLPPLPGPVQALLDSDRVELPGIAAADLRSGVVHESVASALLQLADRWRVRVHVFRTAHPLNVFATTRPSAHTVGRAVDVTALDGVLVIDQDRSPWREFMEAALTVGATDIGGPAELEPVERYFTDRVHQDHIHLGFPLPPDRRV